MELLRPYKVPVLNPKGVVRVSSDLLYTYLVITKVPKGPTTYFDGRRE
jgi:hypothetical protein